MPVEDLESLRSELDVIDRSLLEAVRDRLNVCIRIAEFKRDQDVAMLQPHRIAFVQDRAAAFGAEHSIDGDFLRRLYDLLIEETCRVEDLVIAEDA